MPTSLGPAEIVVIMVVALIFLGPKKLPDAGRQVGKALGEARRLIAQAKREFNLATKVDPPGKGSLPVRLTKATPPPAARKVADMLMKPDPTRENPN